jgi:DNA invertase Pin-like site-specific DNA recombinase
LNQPCQTVANQVRQLRELAAALDFEIFREYTDEETGASANRASFLALLRDARLRRFRVLLITDLDRLTREGAAAGFAHLAELDRYGVGDTSRKGNLCTLRRAKAVSGHSEGPEPALSHPLI